jgi:hypothetical protein
MGFSLESAFEQVEVRFMSGRDFCLQASSRNIQQVLAEQLVQNMVMHTVWIRLNAEERTYKSSIIN